MRTNTYNTQQMLDLQQAGHTQKEIAKLCGCSLHTVKYHLNPRRKKIIQAQNKKWHEANKHRKYHPYKQKANTFQKPQSISKLRITKLSNKSIKSILSDKICQFSKEKVGNRSMYVKPKFKPQDVINKFGENPKCALTGKEINIRDTASYHFDHKIPRSKGGDNSIDNLQIVTNNVNLAKSNLTNEEFLALCKEVLDYANSQKNP